MFTNHFQSSPLALLEMTTLDRLIPLIPETIWLYHSDIPLMILAYVLCRDLLALNKFLYSFVALHVLSNVIFVFWPTTYPREEFPLIAGAMDSWTYAFFSYFRGIETASNCFPSLHVGSVFISAFALFGEKRWKPVVFVLWAIAVSLSTLTTKQHYIQDIFGGLFMAVFVYGIFFRAFNYNKATEPMEFKTTG
ncbi:MAG: hypothetical protein A2X94_03595 [Bdellovibrionales bacterium GWB1_55_8]|nr:MAG: hypothetical protein A2X94_03595 [Bdellovibrionales bacterium GWB1_55_8]